MTRLLLVSTGVMAMALAGCSQRDEGGGAAEAATDAATLAFQYSYTFRLPSARIAAAQDADARRCEQLGPRCRITGMSYTVDGSGEANASLAVALAAPLARQFGREGVAAIEGAGGLLAGAEISGTDTAPDTAAGDTGARRGGAELARIDAQLARHDLPGPERAELVRQRAAAADQARTGADTASTARASVATTPVAFAYHAGRGIGAAAELAEAGGTAYASLLTTLSVVLTALALLGPPALLLLALALLWHRWGMRAWRRLFPARLAFPDA